MLNRFFASSSVGVSSTKAIMKKALSAGVSTVAMIAVTLMFGSFYKAPSLDKAALLDDETASETVEQVAPRGLSRPRTDFEKAIGILADAAAKDARFADYYNRVAKRVKGESVKPEQGSGVRVIRASRKKSQTVNSTEKAASQIAENQPPAPPEGTGAIAEAALAVESLPAPPVPDGYARLTTGDMSYNMNPAIARWVNYYTATQGGRRTMTIGITRSNSYLEMARAEFRREGVPEDLVWLALVESVWNPSAVSPAAAGGIWQFIPKTATEYGLRVARGDDERADPLKQTRVAAVYLRDLYTIFGDWALAMAAYNSGEPRVMDAIVKNGRANFWELYDRQLLPKETRDYVPKILAAIKVASQAHVYGLMPEPQTETYAGY
jgi:transglycosylase-like protein with SLT domain